MNNSEFAPKDFTRLMGLPGMSDLLLKTHFALYEGYVKNTNLLIAKTRELVAQGKAGTPEFAELKRRFGWEFNGMRLHEYFFGNLTKNFEELMPTSTLAKKIVENFGSVEACMAEFKSTGLMRGIGWVILALDKESDRLFTLWVNEHDVGHIAGAKPILVMDVFEHAYIVDYGTNRSAYIDAFLKAIDWVEVEKRLS